MKIAKLAVLVTLVSALAGAGAFVAAATGTHTSTTTSTVVRSRGRAAAGAFLGRWLEDPRVQEELALTSDQVGRLKSLLDESRASIRELRAASVRARADLRATLLDTQAARQDIEKKAAAVREATAAVSKEVTRRTARCPRRADGRSAREAAHARPGAARRGPRRFSPAAGASTAAGPPTGTMPRTERAGCSRESQGAGTSSRRYSHSIVAGGLLEMS
jgi:hypothetical protein